MPKQETLEMPSKLANQRPIRLFVEDDKAIRKLHEDLDEEYDIDISQFIRLCVRAGRPIIEAHFRKR